MAGVERRTTNRSTAGGEKQNTTRFNVEETPERYTTAATSRCPSFLDTFPLAAAIASQCIHPLAEKGAEIEPSGCHKEHRCLINCQFGHLGTEFVG